MSSTINGRVSHWFTELPSPRPALPGDRDADVCIVGASYTGLWTAYYLPEGRSVVADHRPSRAVRRVRGVGPQRRVAVSLAPGHRDCWPRGTAGPR